MIFLLIITITKIMVIFVVMISKLVNLSMKFKEPSTAKCMEMLLLR